jgi:6-phospho-3-hexuloisomerase
MNSTEYAGIILEELSKTLSAVDPEKAERLCDLIEEAEEIFCTGAGRSGFQVKGFAMRLMHMGKKSYVVGETCTPNITANG